MGHSPVAMQQLLNLVISALLPLAPVPHSPNILSPMEALVPSTSPLQEQPRCHHRHWGCSFSALFSFLAEVKKESRQVLSVKQEMKKHFLLGLEELLSNAFSMKRGFLGPPSDVAEGPLFSFKWQTWADVNHTTSSCLYNLQDVKLEIAQSSQETIW